MLERPDSLTPTTIPEELDQSSHSYVVITGVVSNYIAGNPTAEAAAAETSASRKQSKQVVW
jgi:hypothetical protein